MGKLVRNKAEIVSLFKDGWKVAALARKFSTDTSTMYQLLEREGLHVIVQREKISDEKERLISDAYASGVRTGALAKQFQVDIGTVRRIAKRRGCDPNNRGQQPRRFSPSEIAEIRQMAADGISQSKIAKYLKTHQTIISRVMRVERIPHRFKRFSGDRHPSWKGGRVKAGEYWMVHVDISDPVACMADRGGYVREHRLVMARKLGRPLTDSETVHHINGDHADNRPENLQLRHGKHGNGVALKCADCGSCNIVHDNI